MKTQVVFEETNKLIKVAKVLEPSDTSNKPQADVKGKSQATANATEDVLDIAKVSCNFGSSLLYNYNGYNFHPRAIHILANIDELLFRQDDILLTMFPKSGSTWLSECIYLIVNQYKYEVAGNESIELRFPQIDSPSHDVFDIVTNTYNDLSVQRMIKASIPPNLLIEPPNKQKTPQVISILRNPRDVLVSFYHHCKTVKHYDVSFSFDDFFECFVRGRVPCGPIWKMYNDTLDYHKRNKGSSLIVFYEDMKTNLRAEVEKICAFLNMAAPATEADWSQFLDHLSVEKMRQNKTINRHDWTKLGLRNENGFEFVRKGQTSDWKNFFTPKHIQEFDTLIIGQLAPELRQLYA